MSGFFFKENVWEDENTIGFFEVDTKNRVSLPTLWRLMQETAWNHADRIQLGYSDLSQKNHIWVLSRLFIHIHDYPKWGDRIKFQTWLLGIRRLFALRDFSIRDQKGNLMGAAKSAWLVLDLNSRKPQRIEPYLSSMNALPEKHASEGKLEKIPALNHPDTREFFTTRYSDLDMHQHVTNIKYMEWILDSYSFEMNNTHRILTFEMNFLAEASYGDEISVQTEALEGPTIAFLHRVVRKKDDRELCRARTKWKRIESSLPR